ncbi:hypothetical protein PRVXH_000989 [Proteinivorax hydrogeniformans]|uniref:Extracellular solute-binding protein n=1 Tax=Proteinivorax hydrogeniformans TaxID=1826727 RepID=A0AAU8HW83_9FIRM
MNKKVVYLILCLLIIGIGVSVVFWVTADQKVRKHRPNAELDLKRQYEIKVWDMVNPNMYVSEEMQHKVWEQVINDFEKQYENVTVTYTLMEEETFSRRVKRGAKQNKMADIIIDWHGTPFVDKANQFPLEKYLNFEEDFLAGATRYVTGQEGVLAYPILANGEYIVANRDLLEDVDKVAEEGWGFTEFTESFKSASQEMYVIDYQGYFTASMLTQVNITAVEADEKLNWYSQGFVKMYNEIDNLKENKVIGYNPNWLKNFWHKEAPAIAGADSWVYLETIQRNEKLDNNEIKAPGSTHKINPVLLPYPQIEPEQPRYGMKVVSAIPFVQKDYKGDDHSKLVVDFVQFMSGYFVDYYAMQSCLVPVDKRLHAHWKENTVLDDVSYTTAIKTVENGLPIRSRFFKDIEEEAKVLEKVQPILDEYWQSSGGIEKLIEGIQKEG